MVAASREWEQEAAAHGGTCQVSLIEHTRIAYTVGPTACNLLKSLGYNVVNLFPREVPRVINLFPRELIESTPEDFPNANPKLHQRPDPQPKKLFVMFFCGPWHFLNTF